MSAMQSTDPSTHTQTKIQRYQVITALLGTITAIVTLVGGLLTIHFSQQANEAKEKSTQLENTNNQLNTQIQEQAAAATSTTNTTAITSSGQTWTVKFAAVSTLMDSKFVDLDTGTVGTFTSTDATYSIGSQGNYLFTPYYTSSLTVLRSANDANEEGCRTQLRRAPVSEVNDLSPGQKICVLTDAKGIALLTVAKGPEDSKGVLEFTEEYWPPS